MMHDLFLSTAQSCGIMLFIAVTLVVLKWACRYLFNREKVSADPAAPPEPVQVLPVAKPQPREVALSTEWLQTKTAVPMAEIESVPQSEPESVIECGNCGKEIRSGRIKNKCNPMLDVFECEHCGTTVSVRV